MANRESAFIEITPEVLLKAYACGIFPMAESADYPTLFWVEPEMRGVIPLDGFRISSRLARTVRSDAFTITVNKAAPYVLIDGAGLWPYAGAPRAVNGTVRDRFNNVIATPTVTYSGSPDPPTMPGTYTVVVWKEGMLEKPKVSDGKISAYEYSNNHVEEKPVTVEAGKDATVDFTIPFETP